MKTKRNLLVLATLTLALGLGSCGNGSNGSSLDSVTPPTSVEPTTTPTSEVEYLPKLDKKEVVMNNQSKDYTLKCDTVTTYFYPARTQQQACHLQVIRTARQACLQDASLSSGSPSQSLAQPS